MNHSQDQPFRRQRFRLRNLLDDWPMAIAYTFLGVCAVLVLVQGIASPSLIRQGGEVVVTVWGVLCAVATLGGLLGITLQNGVYEIIGLGMTASANTAFMGALILQWITTGDRATLPATCMIGFVTFLCVHRIRDVVRAT